MASTRRASSLKRRKKARTSYSLTSDTRNWASTSSTSLRTTRKSCIRSTWDSSAASSLMNLCSLSMPTCSNRAINSKSEWEKAREPPWNSWRILKDKEKFFLETQSMISASIASWKTMTSPIRWRGNSSKRSASLSSRTFKTSLMPSKHRFLNKTSSFLGLNSSEVDLEFQPLSNAFIYASEWSLLELWTLMSALQEELPSAQRWTVGFSVCPSITL